MAFTLLGRLDPLAVLTREDGAPKFERFSMRACTSADAGAGGMLPPRNAAALCGIGSIGGGGRAGGRASPRALCARLLLRLPIFC